MRLLVLGGTAFVGRHIVESALDAGHEVTLFNRGKTNSDLFPGLERRGGDREAGDLTSLETGEWDALVDVNGYMPQHVQAVCDLVKGRVGIYCFISTGSVYAGRAPGDTDEDAPLAEMEGPVGETWDDTTYGPLKVLCERAVLGSFGSDALIIRPGIVAGPHDGSERFTYWVRRLTKPGPVLAPPRPDQPMQLVHARDQADFLIHRLEARRGGVYNTTGPDDAATFADMVAACAAAAGTDPEIVWAPDQVLRDQKIWLQLMMPASGKWDGIFQHSNERAKADGFHNRSLSALAADTLAWDRTRDQETTMTNLLSPEREKEILALI
jgi:2'-hydroxyisoflavone reductase